MNQPTFADLEYECKKRKTRRELFLERMDGLIPWGQLESRIRPYYPEAGRGRHPYELSAMLRIHCVQLFYNLSDPGMEDMLYEVESVRRFVGLRLSGPLPDETTILNFRHLLEEHDLGEGLFKTINVHLETQGLRLREGTIVDASIIEAPSSTKNRARERDPEMHQTKKGNKWSFGMKVHIGADEETGVVHSVAMTSANVHDVTETHRLLHGGETRVWGDAGYQGVDKREENRELDVEWRVAMKPGRRRQLAPESEEALAEKRKASVRAKVEHPFLYVKRHFGYAKVRYRGLAKNTQRLALLLGFGGTLKKCVNSQAVYPLSEQHGLKAQERRYTAYGKEKHWELVGVKAGVGPVGGLGSRSGPGADPGVAGGRGDGVSRKGEVGPQV